MRIQIFSLFPGYFDSVLTTSILGKAIQENLLKVDVVNLRQYGIGRHHQCDDLPYGGGAGMVMMAAPIVNAFEQNPAISPTAKRIYMSPRGRTLDQKKVEELAQLPEIHLLCGRYEGVDQRVIDGWIDEEISVGDYVLAGGEVAAALLLEAISRLIPEVMGSCQSLDEESFANNLLEYPQYTRPATFRERTVPDVLLSGHHKLIADWRREQSLQLTRLRRPDLLHKKQKAE